MLRLPVTNFTTSIQFNGTNQSGSTAAIDLSGTNKISMVYWVKSTGVGFGNIVLELTTNFNAFTGGFVSSTEAFGHSAAIKGNVGYGLFQASTFNPKSWNRIAVIMDKSASSTNEVKVYVNGGLAGVMASSAENTNNFDNAALFIAARNNASNYTGMNICGIKMYKDYAWTASDVLAEYSSGAVPSSGTVVGIWPCDEGSGTTLTDTSGNGRNFTLLNTPSWSLDVPRKERRAVTNDLFSLKFNENATNQYGSTASTTLGTAQISQAFDFKLIKLPTANTSTFWEISTDINGGEGVWIRLGRSGAGTDKYNLGAIAARGGVFPAASSFIPQINQWYHVDVVTDLSATNKIIIYVNGALLSTYSAAAATGTIGNQPMYFGMRNGASLSSGIQMTNIKVYKNVAWTAAQVQQGFQTKQYGFGGSLVGQWNLSEGAGTTVADVSGNGYTITLTNTPVWFSEVPSKTRTLIT